jgi:hypothetical protein
MNLKDEQDQMWLRQMRRKQDKEKWEREAALRAPVEPPVLCPTASSRGRKYKTYILRGKATRLIKIGKSMNPEKRVADLQCASPDKLILLLVIDKDYERSFHRACDPWRAHGEWFRPYAIQILKNHFKNISGLESIECDYDSSQVVES